MSLIRTFSPWLLVTVPWLIACDDLATIEADRCGNLVVEAREQCDGDERCGTTGAAACRFTCEPDGLACPGALGCSADGICVASTDTFTTAAASARFEMPADRIVVGDLDGDRRDDLIGVGDSIRVRFGAPGTPLLDSYEKSIRPPTGAAAFGELDDQPGLDVVFPTADGVFTLVARGREYESVSYVSTAALPNDAGQACQVGAAPAAWAACQVGDFDRDGVADRVGFVADRDNLELEMGRGNDSFVRVTLDTVDVITDVTTGDFDGDGHADIAFTTRPVDAVGTAAAHVVYGGPQPGAFTIEPIASGLGVAGVAAGELSVPADGLDDLGVELGGPGGGVAVYLGDTARYLSAPFALNSERAARDIPYAVVAGEFVGGPGSGTDVMAYARNPEDGDTTYFWWLRGLGGAQLTVGAVDRVDTGALQFLTEQWRVADLLEEADGLGNGPDEVVGLSARAPGCTGPALSVAVPSARFTAVELLQSACLGVDGAGWQPERVGLVPGVDGGTQHTVAIARRGAAWWVGESVALGSTLSAASLPGSLVALPDRCRDPQVWPLSPDGASIVSWVCDEPAGSSVVRLRSGRDGSRDLATIATATAASTHLVGDFNGDGLTDLVLRDGRQLTLSLQCSMDMAGTTPGC